MQGVHSGEPQIQINDFLLQNQIRLPEQAVSLPPKQRNYVSKEYYTKITFLNIFFVIVTKGHCYRTLPLGSILQSWPLKLCPSA